MTFWFVSCYLGAFGTVWLPYETRCKMGRTRAKSSCPDIALEFFATNTPNPPHWTTNSHFGTFCTIWVHSEPFGCLTKLGAKQAELVQKFVPRSRIGIFRNERTRSTLLDPKLTFWCVLYYLGAFGAVSLPYEPWYKTGRTSAKVRATKSRRNFSERTHLIHPIRA